MNESKWRDVVKGGLRRIAVMLLSLSGVAVVAALVFVTVLDLRPSRAFPLAFYAVGAAVALGGFMSATMGPIPVGSPMNAALIREQGYYTPREHDRALGRALVYGGFGAAVIGVGVLLDGVL